MLVFLLFYTVIGRKLLLFLNNILLLLDHSIKLSPAKHSQSDSPFNFKGTGHEENGCSDEEMGVHKITYFFESSFVNIFVL